MINYDYQQNDHDDKKDNHVVKRMTNKRKNFCPKASEATKIDQQALSVAGQSESLMIKAMIVFRHHL